MGLYLRYAFALLILLGGWHSAHAATRATFNPTSQQIFSQTPYDFPYTTPNGSAALVGKETAYKLTLEGQINSALNASPKVTAAEYGKTSFPYGASAWTGEAPYQSQTLKVKPKVVINKPALFSGVKNALKVSPAQIAGTLAIGALLEGVGWVLDPANNTLQKPADPSTGTPAPKTQYYWKSMSGTYCAANTWATYQEGVACVLAARAQGVYGYTVSIGSTTINSATRKTVNFLLTSTANGSTVNSGSAVLERFGTCPAPYTVVGDDCLQVNLGNVDVVDEDYSDIDDALAALNPEFLADIIRATCEGSLNPSACFSEMEDRSQRTIEGPSSVPGPTSTKTTNYTKADGSPGVRTETTAATHNITYNNTSFDVRTNYTTTIIDNGQVISQTTTEDTGPVDEPAEEEPESIPTYSDSEMPIVEPFYLPKYPDGLQGVWDQKSAEFQDSEFVEFMESFVPDFSGSCPTWSMSFAIGNLANFGTIGFADLCYVFAFIKSCMLLGAVFLCRALIFGG